ncbi:TonB family protein [Sphingopyxis sp. LARHCG72]
MAGLVILAAAMTSPDAEEALRLAPSSNWHVNYADDSCRLARAFGTGDKEVTLVLDRFRPGPKVHMTLTGQPIEVRDGIRRITLRFGPNDPAFEKGVTPGMLGNGKAALVVGGGLWITGYDPAVAAGESDAAQPEPPVIDPALYAAIRFLELRISSKQTVVLETGAMAAAEQALAACTDDLLRGWGIDAEADKSLSRRAAPLGSPGDWIRGSDYPPRMSHLGYQGLVHFRLIVDDQGKPKSCHIQQSTRPKDFDDAVCRKVMVRARFEPALDAGGRPVVSYYTNSARFATPVAR